MTKQRLYILLFALSIAGYAWLAWNVVEGDDAVPTICLFKQVTHLPCPACGSTRSLAMLVHGDLLGSLSVNPLGLVLALGLAIIPVWILLDSLRKKDSFFRWFQRGERMLAGNKWISTPAIALILLNWIWNIAKGL